jgi:beta-ribofuranosylaminobenzene 5'-phosphate synthase
MKVLVTTGSRLHFGLICGTQHTGWDFGGLGVMLQTPSWQLELRDLRQADDHMIASTDVADRIREFLSRIRMHKDIGGLQISVSSTVPFHSGFGSGTQLALGIAAGVDAVCGTCSWNDSFGLAAVVQRAERSAIGTVGFRQGGFLVDHGQPSGSEAIRRVDRHSLPDDWRFVTVRPVDAEGLSGSDERQFFSQQTRMSSELVNHLTDLIECEIVPAVATGEFSRFASSLEQYGDMVGGFYADQQGDIFSHPAIRMLVAQLRKKGIHGAAQSSWGPGIGIPAESPEHSEFIRAAIPESISGAKLLVQISKPLSTGARIVTPGIDERTHTQRV